MSKVVIATSDHKKDKKIVNFYVENRIKYFCGDNENVFNKNAKMC